MTTLEQGTAARTARPTKIRWWVIVVLFVFYTINCIDRASLSVALPTISAEFLLEPAVQGIILSAFFWTYCLFQIPGGAAADRFGPRRGIGVAAVISGEFSGDVGSATLAQFFCFMVFDEVRRLLCFS